VRRHWTAIYALLHRDFVEVGASGRRWTRDEVVDDLAPTGPDVEAGDVRAFEVVEGAVMLTYSSTTLRDAAGRRVGVSRTGAGDRPTSANSMGGA